MTGDNGFRRIAWIFMLVLILLAMLVLGSTLALASVAPFQPGDRLYTALQRPAEQVLVALDRRPSGQARRLIELARHRADDLSHLAGTARESEAVFELERSMVQAVQAVAAASQVDAADLRPQLVGMLQLVEQVLPRVKT